MQPKLNSAQFLLRRISDKNLYIHQNKRNFDFKEGAKGAAIFTPQQVIHVIKQFNAANDMDIEPEKIKIDEHETH